MNTALQSKKNENKRKSLLNRTKEKNSRLESGWDHRVEVQVQVQVHSALSPQLGVSGLDHIDTIRRTNRFRNGEYC